MENARIYPDQPQGISRDDGQWVLGHKEFRYAVVPEQAGELVLPEIRLDWWDTTTNTLQTASLPEHRMMVAASVLAPDLASLSLAEIAELNAARKLPPVDQWHPAAISDSLMVIRADGRWFHDGGEIRRPAMIREFHSQDMNHPCRPRAKFMFPRNLIGENGIFGFCERPYPGIGR